MKSATRLHGIGAALLVLIVAFATFARADTNTDKTGLAIWGFDPVAYFTMNKATPGDFQITATHEGSVYRFASAENRDLFVKNPGAYLPQFGGYCAFGVSIDKKFTADPHVFKVVEGKLYLNLNPEIMKKFDADLKANITKAEQNWPTLAEKPAM